MTYVKHVWESGSRSHVISWVRTYAGVKRVCSCPNCEVNQEDTIPQPLSPTITEG